jgi:hypothetical protein
MLLDDRVGQGKKPASLLVHFLPVRRATPVDRLPVFDRGRHIAHTTFGVLPAASVNVVSSAKKVPKQCDPLSGALFPVYRCGRWPVCMRSGLGCGGWRKDNAVCRQNTMEASVFLPELGILLLRRFESKRF